jgi:hypothetical protein
VKIGGEPTSFTSGSSLVSDQNSPLIRIIRLPQVEDPPERVLDVAVLAFTSPAENFAPLGKEFISRLFKIVDEQFHNRTADFVVFDNEKIDRFGIKAARLGSLERLAKPRTLE